MCTIFYDPKSKGLTRYHKIISIQKFGCKDLLNFPCLTKKFYDYHYAIAQVGGKLVKYSSVPELHGCYCCSIEKLAAYGARAR